MVTIFILIFSVKTMKRENEGNQQINMEELDQEYSNQNTDSQDQEINENDSNAVLKS